MQSLRDIGKRVLPDQFIDWYRRRRALRHFMGELGREVYDRQVKMHVEELEGKVIARRPDLTDRLTKDLMERMDILLQELDRRIEGLRARHGNELRSLRHELSALRASVEELKATTIASTSQARSVD